MKRLSIRIPPNFSLEKARKAQQLLASRVIEKDILPKSIRIVAGADVAYKGDLAFAAAVIMDYRTLNVMEYSVRVLRSRFPYIPTLLSFREAGPIIEAILSLSRSPDILLVDGQGRAHPYRLGLASHVGVVLDIPTIGIAKRRLCGQMLDFKDGWAPIIHEGEIIGAAVITRKGHKPIYVSIGHKISLGTAIRIVRYLCRGYRLPEPVRAAHILATKASRREKL